MGNVCGQEMGWGGVGGGGVHSMLGAGEVSKESLFYSCIQINPSWRR